jgi:hypothetical protein
MKKTFVILLLILTFCTKEDQVTSFLESFPADKYFNEEVFSNDYLGFYGMWKDLGSWGGWSGYSKPRFDFMEIKPFGIYGIIRNDSLLEYGKIYPNISIVNQFSAIAIKLDPEYTSKNINIGTNMYIEIIKKDTLGISDGFIDGIEYLFSRVKK